MTRLKKEHMSGWWPYRPRLVGVLSQDVPFCSNWPSW